MDNISGFSVSGNGFPYHLIKEIKVQIACGDKTALVYELPDGQTIKVKSVSPDKDSLVLELYLNENVEAYHDYRNQPEQELMNKIEMLLNKAQSAKEGQ